MDRNWRPANLNAWIHGKLKSLGAIGIEARDCVFAGYLRLKWPEFPVDSPGAFEKLEHAVGAERLASLDGMLLLLILYRQSIDRVDLKLATELGETIRVVGKQLEPYFHDEGRCTWEHVLRTRVLTWTPDFRPSEASIGRAKDIVRHRYSAQAASSSSRRLHPDKVVGKKMKRRWRRLELMIACCAENPLRTELVGFQRLNVFNGWLGSSRDLIERHIHEALDRQYLDKDEQSTESSLPILDIPADPDHGIAVPRPRSKDGQFFGSWLNEESFRTVQLPE